MIDRAIVFGLTASITTFLFVLELVRRRRLREEYSLLWLVTSLVVLVLATSRPVLDRLAGAIGIFYPPSALFLVAIVFMLFMLLHFSTVLTRLTQENKEIAQQMALLRNDLQATRAELERERERAHSQQRDEGDAV